MKKENVGTYEGTAYVAQESVDSLLCDGCAGKSAHRKHNLTFCKAMPNCTFVERTDRRNVIFVEKKGSRP